MNNKNYALLKENTSYALGFISDLNHTILNTVDLLVYLSVLVVSSGQVPGCINIKSGKV